MNNIKWVKVKKFCELSGYTEKAVTRKRQDGRWVQGLIWKIAPDKNILINLEEYNRWVEGG